MPDAREKMAARAFVIYCPYCGERFQAELEAIRAWCAPEPGEVQMLHCPHCFALYEGFPARARLVERQAVRGAKK